ncbi:MAG: 4Fe-4S dicluster domain-containing protein [Coriobacteriales bacterium]|jgi:formate hydrogenlyase subunit 6/NADH:ubiquinone oxidoreductase subunit I|nr:4Fe-4S dicluster domain-containing protein [Coriobacteriales bacterium]
MGSFHLTKMALRNLVSKPATRLYPLEPPVYTSMTKGHVVNDIDTCILCSICERKCPATALTVDKPNRTWTINPFSCVQCSTCVRICPTKSLRMEPDYTASAVSMQSLTMTKPSEEPSEEPQS